MLIFSNTEIRFCKLIGGDVEVVVIHKDPLLTGVGGMLMPRKGDPVEVECSNADECSHACRDCVWALGVMKTTNDPLDLRISF
jgi:hypothetical protein